MSISFPSLSDTVRLPFAYAEFDPSGASDDPALMPYTVLLAGQRLPSGSAPAHTLQRPMSASQANELFGRGSMLAVMCAAYLNANSVTKMLAMGVNDDAAGEAAAGAVTFSGAVSAAAPVCLYIGGKLVKAAAPYGAAAADIATALATAVNADADLPVSAAHSSGQVTLTAKHKGECGNDIDLRLSYYDEPRPGGIQIAITPMAGGAGNPDAAPIIAAMGDEQFHVIAWPWTDAASLAVLRDELDDRWGPLRQIDGQAVVVRRGSFGQVSTFSGARNDKHLTVLPSEGSPTSPWEDCAASVGVIAYYGNNDPARGFNTLLIPGVLAPAREDVWPGFPEKNQGLFEGLSTRYVAPDGTVRFQKLITTYRLNPLGAEDKAFLSLNSPLTLSYLRYDWNNYLKLKYPRHKLAGDTDAACYDPSQPVMTPKLGKAEAIARFTDVWLPMGLVEGSDQFKRDLLCERNARNENRLDWLLRPDLMNQFEVAGTLFRHIV
ncbi:MAG: phage tail sheath subtilisin-like domain-containing protein [Deltaproteobacteria bacterium]|jgi:phage tail sheath gpL-like|nr:phage tail sheath subtilisin-like domain-containing protein [Deltaproteobacteria bacterium]